MATFDEIQFPTDIRWGMRGGPKFNTTVLETTEGYEFRNRNWSDPLRSWDCTHAVKFQSELDILAAFFRARGGRERGFRFKDWSDYKHDMSLTPTRLLLDEPNGGEHFYQLFKPYSDAGATLIRPITKPVNGTIGITTESDLGGTEFTCVEGVEYTVDYTTGIVSWINEYIDNTPTFTVTNPANVLSTSPHGLVTGDSVWFQSGTGFTSVPDIKRRRFRITRVDDDNFTIDGVDMQVVGVDMDARGVIPNQEIIYWTGEFDVPVRFDNDSMQTTIDSFMTGEGESSHGHSWKRVSVQEIREPLPLAFSDNGDAGDLVHPEVTSSFHEVRFDLDISYGASGGPGFKTILYSGSGGVETRSPNWDQQKAKYDVSEKLKNFEEWIAIQDFFMARWGKAFGFRFRDWSDYKHDMGENPTRSFLANPGGGNGGDTVFPLIKTYTSSNDFVRTISKPVDGTIIISTEHDDGGIEFVAVEDADYTIDHNTGVVTWVSDYIRGSGGLSFVNGTNPMEVITGNLHGLVTGQSVFFSGGTGFTVSPDIQDRRFTVTVTSTTRFTVAGVDLTTAGTGTSASAIVAADELIYWAGEFDVPVRFNTDDMQSSMQNHGLFNWDKIPLVEIRQD